MADIWYGVVPLPDGRMCQAYVRGANFPDTWDEKGGFEVSEEEPLEIENIDGQEPADDELEKVYTIDGETITLEDFCIDWLTTHGKFEYGEDYD